MALRSWQNFTLLSGTVPRCVADDRKHWWLVPCLCWLWGLSSTHLKAWPNFKLNRGCVLSHWQSLTIGKIQLEHAVNAPEDNSFFQSLCSGKNIFSKHHGWAAIEKKGSLRPHKNRTNISSWKETEDILELAWWTGKSKQVWPQQKPQSSAREDFYHLIFVKPLV